jgi:nucleoside-diphosphate kinase
MENKSAIERTFVLLKPEAVVRGVWGEIMARLARTGLWPVEMAERTIDLEFAGLHYGQEIADRYGPEIRQCLLDYITQGPVIAIVMEGTNAVRTVRQIIGEKADPVDCSPGTVRRDLCSDSREAANLEGRALYNLAHSSDSIEAAHREIELWFPKQ